MLSPAQFQQLWSLSDDVLYREAVVFIHELVKREDCQPLPNSQVKGLFNIAKASQYNELERYIAHQRQRDWNAKNRYLKIFYTELEKLLTAMKNKRLKQEFQLLTTTLTPAERIREIDELMAQLAYEFIQHLLAENALLVAELGTEKVTIERAGSKR